MASPQFAALRPLVLQLRQLFASATEPAELRAQLEKAARPEPANVRRVECTVAGCQAEWLLGPDARATHKILYLHGGGYVSGSRRTHRALASQLALQTRCAVLLPDYRLAPEHPYPAALDDAIALLAALPALAIDGHDAPAERVFLGGDSAGGGLALAALQRAKREGIRLPDAAFALSPWTDLTGSGASQFTRADVDPMLTREMGERWAQAYAGTTALDDPGVSPLFGDCAGLPPLLLQVGDAEVLLDDATRFSGRASAAGVSAKFEVWPEMFHVWHAFAPLLPEANQALAHVDAFLRAHS